jgi:hypothetical protein
MEGCIVLTSDIRNAYKNAGEKYEGGPHGRPRRSWEDNMKSCLKVVQFRCVNLIHSLAFGLLGTTYEQLELSI